MTDERMREALEKLVAWVDAMGLEEIAPIDQAREALSPPARRTSYEWVDYSAWKWQVFYDRKRGGWRYEVRTPRGELVTGIPAYEATARLTAAIATLAGLVREEGS